MCSGRYFRTPHGKCVQRDSGCLAVGDRIAIETAMIVRVRDRRRTRFPKVRHPLTYWSTWGQPVEVRSRKTRTALPALSQRVVAVRKAGSRQDRQWGR